MSGTGLQLAVLSCAILQVEVDVAVAVTLCLVIDGRVCHAHLLTDAGHQVGSLIDSAVFKCFFEEEECTLVVFLGQVTGSQRAVSTRNLVRIAIIDKDFQRLLSQPHRQQVVADALWVQVFHCGQVVVDELLTIAIVYQMLGQSLQGIGNEECTTRMPGHEVATHQVVELLLVHLSLCAGDDDAAGTYVIKVVHQLRRVLFYKVCHSEHGLRRLPLQAYIIIIGRRDDGHLCFSIAQSGPLAVIERATVFVYALQTLQRFFAVVVELTVGRATLAQAHLLYVGHEQL